MNSTSGGIGVPTILFVIFLVLKLTHLIDWSWWWVTAPLWIPVLAAVGVGIIAALIYALRVVFRKSPS